MGTAETGGPMGLNARVGGENRCKVDAADSGKFPAAVWERTSQPGGAADLQRRSPHDLAGNVVDAP